MITLDYALNRIKESLGPNACAHDLACLAVISEATKRASSGVSMGWVLNELAGLSFPSVGGAYDYMKKFQTK